MRASLPWDHGLLGCLTGLEGPVGAAPPAAWSAGWSCGTRSAKDVVPPLSATGLQEISRFRSSRFLSSPLVPHRDCPRAELQLAHELQVDMPREPREQCRPVAREP